MFRLHIHGIPVFKKYRQDKADGKESLKAYSKVAALIRVTQQRPEVDESFRGRTANDSRALSYLNTAGHTKVLAKLLKPPKG